MFHLSIQLRFIFLYPAQFGGSEISGGVEQVRQCGLGAKALKCSRSNVDSPAIAPDNRRAQHLIGSINQYQAVHLIRNANGFYVIFCSRVSTEQALSSLYHSLPPLVGMLLGPARLRRLHLHLAVGILGTQQGFPTFCVHQSRFYRRTADVVSNQVHKFVLLFVRLLYSSNLIAAKKAILALIKERFFQKKPT